MKKCIDDMEKEADARVQALLESHRVEIMETAAELKSFMHEASKQAGDESPAVVDMPDIPVETRTRRRGSQVFRSSRIRHRKRVVGGGGALHPESMPTGRRSSVGSTWSNASGLSDASYASATSHVSRSSRTSRASQASRSSRVSGAGKRPRNRARGRGTRRASVGSTTFVVGAGATAGVSAVAFVADSDTDKQHLQQLLHPDTPAGDGSQQAQQNEELGEVFESAANVMLRSSASMKAADSADQPSVGPDGDSSRPKQQDNIGASLASGLATGLAAGLAAGRRAAGAAGSDVTPPQLSAESAAQLAVGEEAGPTLAPNKDPAQAPLEGMPAGLAEQEACRSILRSIDGGEPGASSAPGATGALASSQSAPAEPSKSGAQSNSLREWVKKLVAEKLQPLVFKSVFLRMKSRRAETKNEALRTEVEQLTRKLASLASSITDKTPGAATELLQPTWPADVQEAVHENQQLRELIHRQAAVLSAVRDFVASVDSEVHSATYKQGGCVFSQCEHDLQEARSLLVQIDAVTTAVAAVAQRPIPTLDASDAELPVNADVSMLPLDKQVAHLQSIRQRLLSTVETMSTALEAAKAQLVTAREEAASAKGVAAQAVAEAKAAAQATIKASAPTGGTPPLALDPATTGAHSEVPTPHPVRLRAVAPSHNA